MPTDPQLPQYTKVDASIAPGDVMSLLSPFEVDQMMSIENSELYPLFRRCALAVLNSGALGDDAQHLLKTYHDFKIEIIQQSRGIKLALSNAPAIAFVDGQIIQGIREHLFSVLRDVSYIYQRLQKSDGTQPVSGNAITDKIFKSSIPHSQ